MRTRPSGPFPSKGFSSSKVKSLRFMGGNGGSTAAELDDESVTKILILVTLNFGKWQMTEKRKDVSSSIV